MYSYRNMAIFLQTYMGVFPEGTPWDTFTSDISTNDTAQIQATFSFDGFPLLKDSPNVVDTFIKLVNDMKISATYRKYVDGIVQATESDSRSGGKDLGTGF